MCVKLTYVNRTVQAANHVKHYLRITSCNIIPNEEIHRFRFTNISMMTISNCIQFNVLEKSLNMFHLNNTNIKYKFKYKF